MVFALVLVAIVDIAVEGGDVVKHVGLVDGASPVQGRVSGMKRDRIRLSKIPLFIDIDLANIRPYISVCPAIIC